MTSLLPYESYGCHFLFSLQAQAPQASHLPETPHTFYIYQLHCLPEQAYQQIYGHDPDEEFFNNFYFFLLKIALTG